MNNPYQLVIFDWDGTIIDSQAHIVACMQSAFEQLNLSPPAAADIRHIVGLSLDKGIPVLAPKLDLQQVYRLVDIYRATAYADKKHSSELFEGVSECLHRLHQQNFYLAVATGKGRVGLDSVLATSGLQDIFHITRCADETRSKPHPQMLEEILTDLNLTVDQAVMIGDTVYDIDMANNIGMDSIAVTYGMHDETLLRKSKPSFVIDNIAELHPLLNSH